MSIVSRSARLVPCFAWLAALTLMLLSQVALAQPAKPPAAPPADTAKPPPADTAKPPPADTAKPPPPPPADTAKPPPPAPAPAADDDEPPPVSKETKEKARDHFRKGIKLLNESAWAPALAEFLQSRELFPTRVATNNAGVALRKLQRYDEALEMFENLLREFKNVKDAERKEAQKQIAELRALVGTIDIVGAEPGSSIVVSSVDRGEYPPVKPIRVPAGNHVVRIFKEGFEPYDTRVDVAGGAIASIKAKMRKLTTSGRLQVTERSKRTVTVLVDNVEVGQTPWVGTLGVGQHVVMLRGKGKLGSQPVAAVVKAQQLTNLTLLAEDLDSQLRVDPTPPGATVSINGVDVGNGVWLGRLKSGEHKVEARADGFLTYNQKVTLQKGQRETLKIELERDEDAPIWRKPSKWTFDFGAGLMIVPSMGGDIAKSCEGDCSAGIGLGALALGHASYELGSGLGFGLEIGYLLASQSVEGRSTELVPNGFTNGTLGTADDDLRMQGFMGGATIGYHMGEKYPIVMRLGAGVMIGQVRDERTGTFTPRSGESFSTYPVVDFPMATYFYVDPGVRAGIRLTENFELTGSVQALMLIALDQPTFDNGIELAASTDGIGTYRDEAVMGAFVIAVVPGANLRYDF